MTRTALLILAAAATATADLRVKSTMTVAGQANETLVLTKGARQRMEFGPESILLQQCDLKRTVQLDAKNQRFHVLPANLPAAAPALPCAAEAAPVTAKTGGVVIVKTVVTDTGERQKLFGLTARRVKTTITRTPSAEACDQTKTTVEMDGWYADVTGAAIACDRNPAPSMAAAPVCNAGCRDEIRAEATGAGPGAFGYPLAYTMSTTGADGKAETLEMKVSEFDRATLDAALFDIPAGYADALAKKAGQLRVGVMPVEDRTRMAGAGLEQQLAQSLTQAGVEVLPLRAGEDPKALGMDWVLKAQVLELKAAQEAAKPAGGKFAAGKRFGGFIGKTAGLVNQKPVWETRVEYQLTDVATASPVLASAATGRSGGSSFNVMGAVNLAMTVTPMFMMGGGMMGGGMFSNPLMASLMRMGGGGPGAGMLGGMGPMGGMMGGLGGMSMGPAMMGMQQMMGATAGWGGGAGAAPAATAPTDGEAQKAVQGAMSEIVKAVSEKAKLR